MAIKKEYKITKSNFLNEMRYTSMNLQEIRFLSIYLAKINPLKPETRTVIFPLDDFRKIMNLGRLSISNLKTNTKKLLQNVVTLNLSKGGYDQFQLFKECRVSTNESGEWLVTIDAHDKALPYFFELKRNFFSYELWNMLRLNSTNQQRMYEILKQHQKQKEWTYSYKEIRELLFINDDEYSRFGDFKVCVLNVCQKALKEITDIYFDYELIKKGRSVDKIRFIIKKNTEHCAEISLDEFLGIESDGECSEQLQQEEIIENFKSERLAFLAEACDFEFTELEMQVLFDLVIQIVPTADKSKGENLQILRYTYLIRKYNELKLQASKRKINNRFGYLKRIIESEVEAIKVYT